MSLISRIICVVVLCSFTFTTSAAGILCSLLMPEITESQQSPFDSANESCHSIQKQSTDELFSDCCLDMSSCGVSISFLSNVSLTQLQIAHSSVQLPSNDHVIYKPTSPPERPPKIID